MTNGESEAVDSAALLEAVLVQVKGQRSSIWEEICCGERGLLEDDRSEADSEKSYLSAAARSLERPTETKRDLLCWFAV